MFDKELIAGNFGRYLTENRLVIGGSAVMSGLWALLVIKTCYGSNIRFVYLVTLLFFSYTALGVLCAVLNNWEMFGKN